MVEGENTEDFGPSGVTIKPPAAAKPCVFGTEETACVSVPPREGAQATAPAPGFTWGCHLTIDQTPTAPVIPEGRAQLPDWKPERVAMDPSETTFCTHFMLSF